ncbi:MAG: HD-GYP domain-containing protein [Vallitaleaceae bacterium]|nr:HD-GYP domain-containing protein [Vallitaleaceae bacterium]
MRKIHVDKIKEGMMIGKAIYTANGIILLSDGTVLTQRYIDKIRATGTEHIYILDEMSKGIQPDDLISEETKIEIKMVLQDAVKRMKDGHFTSMPSIFQKVEEMIKEVLLNPRVMVSMQDIRSKSEYLYLHAINVCVVSCLLGKKMNYSDIQLRHLAIGALLHDLGKVNSMFDVNRYREDYVEQEIHTYRGHVLKGYEMIQDTPDISMMSANIVRMHHENFDGSGFPLGLRGDAIHEFAKIVAVANEYDNLLYNSPFGRQLKHYEIIEIIIAKSYTAFDPQIVRVFASSVSPYPLGAGVVLSNGKIGIVSVINPNFPTRPVVRIINPETRQVTEEIDLSKVTSLLIMDEKDIDK